MPDFARRSVALAVCCLFAHAQTLRAAEGYSRMAASRSTAEVQSLRLALESQPLQLKPTKRMLSISPKKDSEDPATANQDVHPTFIIAEQIEGRADEVTEAEGNAELRTLDTQLLADRMKYFPLEDVVEATGNVQLTQSKGLSQTEIGGTFLRLKVSEQLGYIDNADFHVRSTVKVKSFDRYLLQQAAARRSLNSAALATTNVPMMLSVPPAYGLQEVLPRTRPRDVYGKAERVTFEGDNQMRMSEAEYSSCKPSEKDWYLKAKELYLDYDAERGSAKEGTLYFKEQPLLYIPYGSFSLNRKPHSGFLAPAFSVSTKNGVDVTAPYYWSIAPNYDLTLHPRVMSKRGVQLGAETRYLDYNFFGTSRFEYMPEDKKTGESRYAYSVLHNQKLGRGLGLAINWNGVSDDRYWSDMSSRLMQTSQVQLPRRVDVSFNPGGSASWLSGSATWLRYQTLQPDPATPVTRPYFIEPQINLMAAKSNIHGFDFGMQTQYTRFTDPNRDDGDRLVMYPQLAFPYFHPAFTIQPKVGVHMTSYDLNRRTTTGSENINRTVPIFSLDSSMAFERELTLGGKDFVQTLEPRLYYLNIPYRDQSKIPVFDTGVSDFNFAQIFSENRYTGHDRINNANHLTAALTSRMIDGSTGAELFKGMIGQRYYFNKQRVYAPGETSLPEDFSNLLVAFNGLVAPKTYVDGAWEYNYHERSNQRFSLGARYQPDNARVISGSYRFARDAYGQDRQVDQFDIALQWPIAKGWYAVGRYNYSMLDKRLLEGIAGLEYTANCWAARFVVQRLEAVAGSPNTTFFFQLELNDFASVGPSPLQLLRRSIPGYGKVNEMPMTGSLLTSE